MGFAAGVIFDAILVMLLVKAEDIDETKGNKLKMADFDKTTFDGDITLS